MSMFMAIHVYKKGALVAHNLRGYLGDHKFFDAVSSLMEDFKYTSVSSDTLEKTFINLQRDRSCSLFPRLGFFWWI